MKKLFGILLICLLPLMANAQIKPKSIGTFLHYSVGGPTDIFVQLTYTEELDYFALSLREKNYAERFSVRLGKNKEEAITSLNNLLEVMEKGKKHERYIIDDRTFLEKTSSIRMDVVRAGKYDAGYVEKRHLKSAIKFIEQL